MGPMVILLMYESHDMRHIGFCKLTVVNRTPEFWGVTFSLNFWIICLHQELHKKKKKKNHGRWYYTIVCQLGQVVLQSVRINYTLFLLQICSFSAK